EDLTTLAELLVPQTPEELQTAAAASLGRLRDPQIPGVLLRGWKSYSPKMRAQGLDVLLQREEGVKSVLDSVQEQQLMPVAIDAVRRQGLRQYKAAGLRERAAKLLADTASADRQKVIDEYRPALARPADPARGAQLFAKTCATCHRF